MLVILLGHINIRFSIQYNKSAVSKTRIQNILNKIKLFLTRIYLWVAILQIITKNDICNY